VELVSQEEPVSEKIVLTSPVCDTSPLPATTKAEVEFVSEEGPLSENVWLTEFVRGTLQLPAVVKAEARLVTDNFLTSGLAVEETNVRSGFVAVAKLVVVEDSFTSLAKVLTKLGTGKAITTSSKEVNEEEAKIVAHFLYQFCQAATWWFKRSTSFNKTSNFLRFRSQASRAERRVRGESMAVLAFQSEPDP